MGKQKLRAPLAEAMRDYAAKKPSAFHTPGHKQGLGAHELLKELVTPAGLAREVSVADALDDLVDASGCIREAQDSAAALYGAEAAFFAVNGTTGAIHAMVMATLKPGDKALVARNIHRSTLNALILAGAEPIFLPPTINVEFGLAMGLSVETVRQAVAVNPGAKALILTSPTYCGAASDLTSLADILHQNKMLLLVDEAHGAHLKFSDRLPPDAITSGADMAAQSTHKLLGAMTQCSLLLLGKTGGIDRRRLHQALTLLTTTSPNYLLLASLDIARFQMADQGEFLVNRAVDLAGELRHKLSLLPEIKLLTPQHLDADQELDATKITVSVAGLGLSGSEAMKILRQEYGIEAELADATNVLFIISYADGREQTNRLANALADLAKRRRGETATPFVAPLPPIPRQIITPRKAFFAAQRVLPLAEAAGSIAAEEIMFYPPGVPVICPGEEIDQAALDYLRLMKKSGCKVAGAADLSLETVLVINETESLRNKQEEAFCETWQADCD